MSEEEYRDIKDRERTSTMIHELEPLRIDNELDGTSSTAPRLGTHEMHGSEAAQEVDGSSKRLPVYELP